MRIIKNNEILSDVWEVLSDDAPLPASGAVLVSPERWSRGVDDARLRVGLLLQTDANPAKLSGLEGLPLIAIEFSKFGDGRGYSLARLLRERYGFRGELRAIGDVLRDQLFYLKRCGFDSFALKDGKDVEGALTAFKDFSVSYQGASDDARPLYRRFAR